MKPGWKTSEFWVTFVIVVVGMLGASGVVADGSSTERIVALIVSALAAMGYTGVRGGVKKKLEATKNGGSEDGSGGTA